jgi:hypothetical protein
MSQKRPLGASLDRVTLRPACLAFSLFLAVPSVEADEGKVVSSSTDGERIVIRSENRDGYEHLKPESRLADLLKHPAFAGHARLLLPWDERAYDESMQISDISLLLPYHTNVDANVVVSALNRMIDDANDGNTVFYDFYTAEENGQSRPARIRACSFSGANPVRLSRSSLQAADSHMLAPSTRVFRMPLRSARRGTTFSC